MTTYWHLIEEKTIKITRYEVWKATHPSTLLIEHSPSARELTDDLCLLKIDLEKQRAEIHLLAGCALNC